MKNLTESLRLEIHHNTSKFLDMWKIYHMYVIFNNVNSSNECRISFHFFVSSSIFFNKIFIIFMQRFFISLFKLEKEMATHSSILAWKIPWMEKPGRLPSMGWQRVGHDRATSLSLEVIPVHHIRSTWCLITDVNWCKLWLSAICQVPDG